MIEQGGRSNREYSHEKITIQSIADLQRELEITHDIQRLDFSTPFDTTKTALDTLRGEIAGLQDEQEKNLRIEQFIEAQRNVITHTQDGLSEILEGRLPTTAGVLGFGAISAGLMKAYDTAHPNANGLDRMFHKISTFSKAVGYMWRKFMHEKMPMLAKWFGIDEPKNPLEDITDMGNVAQGIAQNATESVKSGIERIDTEYTRKNIFFAMFSGIDELREAGVQAGISEPNYRKTVSTILSLDNNFFNALRYNDFLGTNRTELRSRILGKLQHSTVLRDISESERILYIDLFILNISGGDFVYTRENGESGTCAIHGGSEFLRRAYKTKTGIDLDTQTPSPTLEEIFATVGFLNQFSGVFGGMNLGEMSYNAINTDGIGRALQGASTVFDRIDNNGNLNVGEDDIHVMLENMTDTTFLNAQNFTLISQYVLQGDPSRTFGRANFGIDEHQADRGEGGILETRTIGTDKTMGDFLEHLYGFGEGLYNSMLQNEFIPPGLSRTQIDLKKMYALYLMTGGKTDISTLNTMQKSQLFLFCQFNFIHTGAQGAGNLFAQGIEAMIQESGEARGKFTAFMERHPDIKNILEVLGRFIKRVVVGIVNIAKNVFVGIHEHSPLIAFGVVALILFTPVFSKRTSLFGMLPGTR